MLPVRPSSRWWKCLRPTSTERPTTADNSFLPLVFDLASSAKRRNPPRSDSWELTTGVNMFVFLTSGGDGPAPHLRLLLLLAGDIHPHQGHSWPCPACACSAARGSVLCTTCNQWWHLSAQASVTAQILREVGRVSHA